MVWKLDRLGFSLPGLPDLATTLAERGVCFKSVQGVIEGTTLGGKLVFHMFGALAECERDLVRERTTAVLVPRPHGWDGPRHLPKLSSG